VPNETRGAAFFVVPIRRSPKKNAARGARPRKRRRHQRRHALQAACVFARGRAGERFVLEDGGSKNGTFVEDAASPPAATAPPSHCRHRAALRFGSISLRFLLAEDLRAFLRDKRALECAVNPRVFGRYEIIRRIAAGGMGEIFLARQVGVAGFDRLVTLKSILPEHASDPRRPRRLLERSAHHRLHQPPQT